MVKGLLLSLSVQMCLDSSVSLILLLCRKDAVWFLWRSLKFVARPTYESDDVCVVYIYIYIYILKTMKNVFFAFALRVSQLLRLFRHSKVFLLTYYVTDVIVITIIMALVIRSTREQLA